MSFGLGNGRALDAAPGVVGIGDGELPPLPDDVVANPGSGRVDPRAWFGEPGRPLEIEIGSGKGTFLLDHAEVHPEINLLGIEWAGEFYAYASDRVRRRGLANVRVLHADATQFLRWRVPDGIVRVIHLYFSDPWPKTRHHKKRVVQDRFLGDVWRVLGPGGELRVVTDHDGLWEWDREHFERWCAPGSVALAMGNGRWAMGGGHKAQGTGHKGECEGAGGAGILPADEEPDTPPGRKPVPPAAFEMLPFAAPESAGEGELIGTNFERKFRREGRSFHACVLRKPDDTVR